MIPVVTTAQMKAVDQGAPEPVDELVRRAGLAVARAALALLGGTYGRRVVIVTGKGNNGADGRAAGEILAGRGVRVRVVDAAAITGGGRLPHADLIIDAAYGTGFRGSYVPPDPGDTPVLAVDIPSGLDGDTGLPGSQSDRADRAGTAPSGGGARDSGRGADRAGSAPEPAPAMRASLTVTFAAYKPGLLLGEGPDLAGAVEVADIGLDPGVRQRCTIELIEDRDVADSVPARPRNAHKWQSAVIVVAGSPGMMGAPGLVSRAAMRAGAGYARLGVPGASLAAIPSAEAVGLPLPAAGWSEPALAAAARCRAMVVGPGLGRGPAVQTEVRRLLAAAALPVVLDADGLNAVGTAPELAAIVGRRSHPLVITPHEGEYAGLFGQPPGPDRLGDVRAVAAATGAIVLLKGSTTIVAHPDGRALLAASGSPRLAAAGTGDVLSGVIGAFVARGVDPFLAAAIGAHVHGRAAGLGRAEGLIASDLPDLVSRWLSDTRT